MKDVVKFIIGILLVVVAQSCSQKDSIENSLNLTAPSGDLISENTLSLKKELSTVIAQKHGISGDDFQLTKIDYVPLETGYSATITYKYDNDKEDVIIVSVSAILYCCPFLALISLRGIKMQHYGFRK